MLHLDLVSVHTTWRSLLHSHSMHELDDFHLYPTGRGVPFTMQPLNVGVEEAVPEVVVSCVTGVVASGVVVPDGPVVVPSDEVPLPVVGFGVEVPLGPEGVGVGVDVPVVFVTTGVSVT